MLENKLKVEEAFDSENDLTKLRAIVAVDAAASEDFRRALHAQLPNLGGVNLQDKTANQDALANDSLADIKEKAQGRINKLSIERIKEITPKKAYSAEEPGIKEGVKRFGTYAGLTALGLTLLGLPAAIAIGKAVGGNADLRQRQALDKQVFPILDELKANFTAAEVNSFLKKRYGNENYDVKLGLGDTSFNSQQDAAALMDIGNAIIAKRKELNSVANIYIHKDRNDFYGEYNASQMVTKVTDPSSPVIPHAAAAADQAAVIPNNANIDGKLSTPITYEGKRLAKGEDITTTVKDSAGRKVGDITQDPTTGKATNTTTNLAQLSTADMFALALKQAELALRHHDMDKEMTVNTSNKKYGAMLSYCLSILSPDVMFSKGWTRSNKELKLYRVDSKSTPEPISYSRFSDRTKLEHKFWEEHNVIREDGFIPPLGTAPEIVAMRGRITAAQSDLKKNAKLSQMKAEMKDGREQGLTAKEFIESGHGSKKTITATNEGREGKATVKHENAPDKGAIKPKF